MTAQTFPLRCDSVPAVRRHVAQVLGEWQLPGLVEAAEHIASELAANAVRHAKGIGDRYEVALSLRDGDVDGVVVIEVADSCQWRMPQQAWPEWHEESGRGLLIVEALASRWGVRPRDPGKTAWAELDVAAGVVAAC